MVGRERSECWASRPSVRFRGFLVALASLVFAVALAVFFGFDVVGLVAIGSGVVAIVRPYVFQDGAS